uniref:Uncharacterized protein AlNc14C26G2568 n=1 Tax=Albugo laibachii Nc14 TaxID=890382 RepID=F0W6T2_9STRA|nr:conserved hypothetical protein [Albugo laibachii Nc14]|eukprot:CCA16827.1 conserved hypothetical protein [Albugo laibachii Nc14]
MALESVKQKETDTESNRNDLKAHEERDELCEQLAVLETLEQSQNDKKDGKSTRTIHNTINWIKVRSSAIVEARNRPTLFLDRSSSFVRSVRTFFNRSRLNSHNEFETSNQEEEEGADGSPEKLGDDFPKLCSPWGQDILKCGWTRFGFTLLNQCVHEDLTCLRQLVGKQEIDCLSPGCREAFLEWLTLFTQHVEYVAQLKEALNEERSILAGVQYTMEVSMDCFRLAVQNAKDKLAQNDDDVKLAMTTIVESLEAFLNEELTSIESSIRESLDEDFEYDAVSAMFSQIKEDDPKIIILAKTLAWIKRIDMPLHRRNEFLTLISHSVYEKAITDGMRQFVSYLRLLNKARQAKVTTEVEK